MTPGILSDHSLITFNLPTHKALVVPAKRQNRNWKKFDLDSFLFDLLNSSICSCFISNCIDVSYLVNLYNSVLLDLMDKHAPMITINVSQRDHNAPWFDGEC